MTRIGKNLPEGGKYCGDPPHDRDWQKCGDPPHDRDFQGYVILLRHHITSPKLRHTITSSGYVITSTHTIDYVIRYVIQNQKGVSIVEILRMSLYTTGIQTNNHGAYFSL